MRILFLDDAPWRHKLVRAKFQNTDTEVVHVWTVDECIEAFQTKGSFDHIYLDHDLNDYVDKTGRFSMCAGMYGDEKLNGSHVTNWIAHNMKECPRVTIHSWNHGGAQNMRADLQAVGFPVVWELFNGGCGPGDDDYVGPADNMDGWVD